MTKKKLTQKAVLALMCAATSPAVGHAGEFVGSGTMLAGGGCAASSTPSRPYQTGCAASSNQPRPYQTGCAASSNQPRPYQTGCAASSNQPRPYQAGCAASSNQPQYYQTGCAASYGQPQEYRVSCAASTSNASGTASRNNPMSGETSDMSSYSGTTTGPGINGGYPGTPSGSYQAPSGQQPNRNATNELYK